ncbi:type VI secretion system Vgr family protein, partial [Pseudomonas lactis]
QGWAGATWGAMAVPRIGQELIIGYLDGDPDQPIATGRTYRETNLPPYELPKHKTRMTIKSQTHKGNGFNELRFEDELGHEEVFIHAEKDKNVHVKHDNTTFVGNNRKEEVGNDEQITIGNDQSHVIGRDHTLSSGRDHETTVGRDRSERVGNNRYDTTTANHHSEVGGHCQQTISGQHRLTAGQGIHHTTTVYQLQASERVVFQSPGGSLTLDAQGIHLNGIAITLRGPVNATNPCKGQALKLQLQPETGQACVEKNR